MKDFVDLLEEVNTAGEKSPGFVWILKDETQTAIYFNLFNDPSLLVNLTVWQNIESLKAFIYKGLHAEVFKRRREWFQPMDKEHLVLWWIKEGHIPSTDEARLKMEKLWREGPSADAFTFKAIYKPEHNLSYPQ
jgi:hypothetical protein